MITSGVNWDFFTYLEYFFASRLSECYTTSSYLKHEFMMLLYVSHTWYYPNLTKKIHLRLVVHFFQFPIIFVLQCDQTFLVISETTWNWISHLFDLYVYCFLTISQSRCKNHLMLKIYNGFHNHFVVPFGPSFRFHRPTYVPLT